MKPTVSVVIPTYNSEDTFGVCLRSISKQTYPKIEIIVVDNHSTDRTREIADRFGARIYLKGPERASQVNFAVRKAKGKYVYRVDSDFVLGPSIVQEAVRKCEEEGYDAVCVHNTADPSISFWTRVSKLERDCYAGDKLNVAARFVRKDIFEAIGGFNEELIAAEDYDLHNRLLKYGCKIGEIETKELHMGEPKTLWELARKYYYYGKTIKSFLEENPERGRKQLSPIRSAFLRNWKEFARHPVLTVGFFVYQAVRYSAAGLGFFVSEVKR
jgi:glycosyltransferase involved in cell wall biosynthesis